MGGNTSTIAKEANVNAAARERRESHGNWHYNKCPKPRTNRAPRSGAIAIFAILTPQAREVKNRAKQPQVSSLHFEYISTIDI